MHVYFTTVVRGASLEKGGELVWLDWKTKTIRRRVPIVPTNPDVVDPNPRGNSRGGRGIVLRDDKLFVASYHSLLVFDRELTPLGRVDNGLFVGLHELGQDAEGIWAAATAIDGAIHVDDRGALLGAWWARETPALQQRLGLVPREIDKGADNRLRFLGDQHLKGSHTHLNASTWHDGELYILFNRYGMVYNATRDEVVVHRPDMKGAHNIVFTSRYLLVNHTQGRKVMVFTHEGALVREVDLLQFPLVQRIFRGTRLKRLTGLVAWKLFGKAHVPRPIFVRGLCALDERRVLVGFSPATILELDIEQERVLDSFQFSSDLAVCTHGILAVRE